MMHWTCLDCGKDYEGRFSDSCPVCHGGRAIIDPTGKPYSEQILNRDIPVATAVVTSTMSSMAPATQEPVPEPVAGIMNQVETFSSGESVGGEGVTKINRSKHRRRGRPPVLVEGQLSLADQKGLSLRKRAAILGVSRMTVSRRDRKKNDP